MAPTDDDHPEMTTSGVLPLEDVRRSRDAARVDEATTWLVAGDRLAEKAIAALDTGDGGRAGRLARQIIALPEVAEGTPSGPMAVSVLLRGEILDPSFPDDTQPSLLERPIALLPGLDPHVADELGRVLASFTDSGLPAALVRRLEQVVPIERGQEAPFTGVLPEQLPTAITGVLQLVLVLRGATA